MEPDDQGQFVPFLSMDGFLDLHDDPESVALQAAELYEACIANMRLLVSDMHSRRMERRMIPARMMWNLGDAIFGLRDRLEALSLELDDLYGHLMRDLRVKRKWLEKAVIFRRHIPCKSMIPESLNWGRCEKGTRHVAERLRNGLLP